MSRLGRYLTLGFAFVFASMVVSFAGVRPAAADVVIAIDKSAQRMSVMVNGVHRHSWAISSGLGGGPPSGSYRPQRMERKWYLA